IIRIEDSDVASKSTHGLRQFDTYVATTNNKEMFRNPVEFECFNVSEWLGLCEPRNGGYRSVSPGTNNHVRSAQLAYTSVTQRDFYGLGSDESSGPKDQLRSGLLVIFQVHFVQA